MIERDSLGAPALGLRQYLLAVAEALDAPAWFCEVTVPAGAYLVLERRLPRFPEHDTAMLWDERDGWSLAVETASGEDLITLAYLGAELLPPPDEVVRFVRDLLAGGHPGRPDPPAFRRPGDPDGFEELLAAHAGPRTPLPESRP